MKMLLHFCVLIQLKAYFSLIIVSGHARILIYFKLTYCRLQQVFVGITEKKPFKRHQMMNEIAYEKVIEQASVKFFNLYFYFNAAAQQQVLIFVHTRKDTAATAKAILALAQTNDTLHKVFD